MQCRKCAHPAIEHAQNFAKVCMNDARDCFKRDHKDRGGRFCANNSTSIRTRLRQKIDKNNDEIFGLCLLRITGHHKNIESPCPLFEARIANIFGNLSWLVLCCIEVDSDVVALLSYAHLPITTTGVTKDDQAH